MTPLARRTATLGGRSVAVDAPSTAVADGVVAALFALALGLFFSKAVGDWDFWFHLVVGRRVVEAGAIPDTNFYVAPLLGAPDGFYEWGFGTLLYLLQRAFGDAGIALLNMVCAAGAILVLALAGRRGLERNVWIAAAAVAVVPVALLVDVRAVARAELVLMLLMAVEIALLEAFRRHGGASVWWLPGLAFVLSNIHPSSLLLIAVAGLYALDHWFDDRSAALFRRYLGLIVAMFAAACVNPYGPTQVLLPFTMAGSEQLMGRVAEFFPLARSSHVPAFVAMALACAGSFAVARGPGWRARAALCMVFGGLTVMYTRNIAIFALVALLPLRDLAAWAITRRVVPAGLRESGVLAFGLVLAMAASLGVARAARGGFGFGVDLADLPSYAPRLAAHEAVHGVATLMERGGYMAWMTRKPVLADGRNYTYNDAFVAHDRVFSRQPDWASVLERYRIDVIFTPALQKVGGTPVPLLGALFYDERWRLCAVDETGLWFRRLEADAAGGLDKRIVLDRILDDVAATGARPKATDPVYRLALSGGVPGRRLAAPQPARCL